MKSDNGDKEAFTKMIQKSKIDNPYISLDDEEDKNDPNTKIDEIVVIPKNMSEGLVDSVNENGFVQNSNDPNSSVFDP